MLWNQFEDKTSIQDFDKMEICITITKRDVLNNFAKVFDLLGLLTPLTLVSTEVMEN